MIPEFELVEKGVAHRYISNGFNKDPNARGFGLCPALNVSSCATPTIQHQEIHGKIIAIH
jgi:hypothetical protein